MLSLAYDNDVAVTEFTYGHGSAPSPHAQAALEPALHRRTLGGLGRSGTIFYTMPPCVAGVRPEQYESTALSHSAELAAATCHRPRNFCQSPIGAAVRSRRGRLQRSDAREAAARRHHLTLCHRRAALRQARLHPLAAGGVRDSARRE